MNTLVIGLIEARTVGIKNQIQFVLIAQSAKAGQTDIKNKVAQKTAILVSVISQRPKFLKFILTPAIYFSLAILFIVIIFFVKHPSSFGSVSSCLLAEQL